MTREEIAAIEAAWEDGKRRADAKELPDPLRTAGIIVRVPRLCAALRAALDRAECAEAEVRLFVDASGCANGEVLSERLAAVGRILRKTPVEHLADAAERVVKRAERAEVVGKIERALRTARHCGLREYEILKLRADLRALGVEP